MVSACSPGADPQWSSWGSGGQRVPTPTKTRTFQQKLFPACKRKALAVQVCQQQQPTPTSRGAFTPTHKLLPTQALAPAPMPELPVSLPAGVTGGDYSAPTGNTKPPILLQDFLSDIPPTLMLPTRLRPKSGPLPIQGPKPTPVPNNMPTPTPGSTPVPMAELKQPPAPAPQAAPPGLKQTTSTPT